MSTFTHLHSAIKRSKQDLGNQANKIPIIESGEMLTALIDSARIILDPIWVTPIDDIEGPLYRQYIEKNPDYRSIYTRSSIVEMIENVPQFLPSQWQLIVRAAHRPVQVQNLLFEWILHKIKNDSPSISPDDALQRARMFVSDPAVKLPPHCCGSAVDVDILDKSIGKLVDFGCPMNTDDDIAYLHSNLISKKQYDNRLILLTAMLKVGFASLYSEWWHYSYGDQNWAAFYNKNEAIYGIIEPKLLTNS